MHIFVFTVLFISIAGVSQPGYAASADKRGSLLERGPEIGLSPAEIEQAQLATGLVVCPGVRGSGALVLSNQTIVTAAHLFFDEQDRRQESLSECYFEWQSDPHVRVNLDTASIVFGVPDRAYYSGGDWAVVRLVSPIHRAKPYRPLPLPREGDPIPKGKRLISVATVAHDLNSNPNISTVEECTVTETRFNGRFVFSDCISSFGMSGSIILTRHDGELLAAGITTGRMERHIFDGAGNAREEHASMHTALQQDFLRTLTNMARCGKAVCE